MSFSHSGVISDIQFTIQQAQNSGKWVVAICPDDSEFIKGFRKIGVTLLPEGSYLSGRTAILPEGGKVSFAEVSEPFFVPEDQPFLVVFVGWEDDIVSDNKRMTEWRNRALRVIDRMLS